MDADWTVALERANAHAIAIPDMPAICAGSYITSSFPVFLQKLATICGGQWSFVFEYLKTAEITTKSSASSLPFYLPLPHNCRIVYDKTGRITEISQGNDLLKGEPLRVYASMWVRHATCAYIGKDAIMYVRPYTTRSVGDKNYFQTISRSVRIATTAAATAYNDLSVVLGYALKTVTNVPLSLQTLTAIHSLANNLGEILASSPDPTQIPTATAYLKAAVMTSCADYEGDVKTIEDESIPGVVLKFGESIECIAASKLTMEELTRKLQNITSVRQLTSLFTSLGLRLPRSVDANKPLRGPGNNPIAVQTIDNVGPGNWVLTERQKATPTAVRSFLQSADWQVYYAAFHPVQVAKSETARKRNRRGRQSENAFTDHESLQASLFQALRHDVIQGGFRPDAQPETPPAPAQNVNLITF